MRRRQFGRPTEFQTGVPGTYAGRTPIFRGEYHGSCGNCGFYGFFPPEALARRRKAREKLGRLLAGRWKSLGWALLRPLDD